VAETQWQRLIEKTMDEFKTETRGDIAALEKRVRSLEDLRHWVLGAAAVIGAVVATLGKVILQQLHLIKG
jgi:hypothetical protein